MKKIILIIVLPIILFLTSCSAFVGGDDGKLIDTITTNLNSNGDTTVTITFTDGSDDVTFTIPKGEQGNDGLNGVGITSIEEKDGVLVITFTDNTVKEIPIDKEEITNISSTYDEKTRETTITISTNKEDYEFVIKDPVGISEITRTTDGNTGNVVIEIVLTNGTKKEIIIPKGEKGEPGKGIASIVAEENNTEYILHVTYDDEEETTETFIFQKPQSTAWYSGAGAPNMITGAKNGDYYFDTANFRFYRYVSTQMKWELVADLGITGEACTVTFNAVENGGSIISGNSIIECTKGDYISLGSIPIAYKEGYTFVGWYTDPNANTNPNAEKFTDLTPVMTNLVLYACFEEIVE